MRDIKAHTGLRGIAALAVFLAHARFNDFWPRQAWLAGLYSFVYWQNSAVDLFFMLSGFVLNYAYLKGRKLDWRDYLTARFARICPLYYAGMISMMAMDYVSAHTGQNNSGGMPVSDIVRNILLIQEWPLGRTVNSVLFPEWSISVEMFLYLAIFPLMALFFLRRRIPRFALLLILAATVAANASLGVENPFGVQYVFAPVLRGVTGFAAGFIICEILYDRTELLLPLMGEIALALAAMVCMRFVTLHWLLPVIFVGVMAVTYSEGSWLGQVLGSRLFAWLGTISYSIYIWHVPVVRACAIALRVRQMGGDTYGPNISTSRRLLFCLVATCAVLLVGSASYYWFENPVRRALRRRKTAAPSGRTAPVFYHAHADNLDPTAE
jgi:peptidoglycan/LPS O-acetylase OafA/YrhL